MFFVDFQLTMWVQTLVLQLRLRLAHYSAAILFPGRIACWLRVCL